MTTSTQRTALTTLPATATAADIAEATNRDGGVIVKNVLSEELLAQINSEVDPYLAAENPSKGYGDDPEFYGRRTKRLEGLVQKSDAVVEAVLDERLQLWVHECLDWGADFQLNTAQVIEIGPGEPAQELHRDELLWPQVAGGHHELMVSCMLALSDFTEDVGATRVVPGSHTDASPDCSQYDAAKDSVPAVMNAGDALFFTGKVVHGGGPNNTTNRSRRGLTITFSLGWLRSEEANTLAITHDRAKQLPPRMRELCSFAAYYPYGRDNTVLYFRLDMDDPYRILFDEPRP
ncbi:phytanoyl-CoA dioxygenase family protein [Mycolicibacterium baixiangningiae]|uniref:phytanoyl-CoA dioxygenase family protein n=1 Tax=Mycolicibacterium baixiangningiae TaxID=2761578 RepID=UPI00186864D9|nr:phytanoyl-CoA dioxygenase family protein [Mycolicibacterium baixiangningiae]